MKRNFLILGFTLLFMGYSCSDELEKPQRTNLINFDIKDAYRYFEQNATDLAPLRFIENAETKSTDLPTIELIPDWDHALQSGHSEVSLIEVPILSNTTNFFTEKIFEKSKFVHGRNFESHCRLVIARRKSGGTDMFMVTIIQSGNTFDNSEKKLKDFRYLGGGNFTGLVFCSTLEGQFVKAFGYTNGRLNGPLIAMTRTELEKHAFKLDEDYSIINIQNGTMTRAGTYNFMETGGMGTCPHGYSGGSCPYCLNEVVVVACPYCHVTNGCICPKCFYCGKKEAACTCPRCPRCRKKTPQCTCYYYPGSGGSTSGGGGGGSSIGSGDSDQSGKQNGGKVTVTKITSAASKAVQAAISKYGTDKASCNYGVQTAFNELYSSKELNNKNANTIVNYWKDNPSKWEPIMMSEAQKLANEGWFVVAGWIASSGSGHVVVIVPGETSKGNWNGVFTDLPKTMDTGAHMRTSSQPINRSFGKTKHKDVKFFKYK